MSLANKIKAGMAYIELSLDGAKLERGLKKAQTTMRSFGSSMQAAGGDMLKLSSMMAIPMAFATKTFASFDDTMRVVQAISQATAQEFVALTATARKLGATTAFTAQQVAEGMVSLARMGFTASEVDESMESMLYLTRATGNEVFRLGEITLIAGSAMRTFGLASSEAGDVANLLTYAANNSAQSVQDLGEALKTAGPSARTVKEDLRDVAAATMALAQMGIKGSLAGTALRKSYDSLSRQTSVFRTEMKDLGIDVTQDNGELRKMVDIMGDLAVEFKNMPGPKALEKAREIFDLRGSLAALALTTDPAAFKRFRAEINNVAGLAKKTHDKMEEGLGGAFRLIVSRVQELAIVIGDAIDKEFRDFFNILVKLLDATGEWARNNQDVIVQFVKYVAAITVAGTAMIAFGLAIKVAALALTPVLIALKAISFGIGAFVVAFKALVVIITGGAAFINAAMISMSAVLALVKASFIALTGAATVGWTAAFAPVAAGIILIGGLTAAVVLLTKAFASTFSRISTIVADSFGIIKESLSAGDLAGATKVALSALALSWQEGVFTIKRIWNGLAYILKSVWDGASYALLIGANELWNGLIVSFTWVGNKIADIWGGIWDGIIVTFWKTVNALEHGVTYLAAIGLGEKYQKQKHAEVDKRTEDKIAERLKQSADAKAKRDLASTQGGVERDKFREGIIEAAKEQTTKNETAFDEATKKNEAELDEARKKYDEAKTFATNFSSMQTAVKELQKIFDESAKGYQTDGKSTDVAAQNQDAYFRALARNNKLAAVTEVKNALEAEEEKLKLQKDLWQQAVNEAKADRVISNEEAQGINALAFGKGRAEVRTAMLKDMLASLSAGTARAAASVDEKALGKEQVSGSWSAKNLSAMLGKNFEQRTANATEALLKETKDTNRIIKNSWGVPMVTWS